MWLENNVLLTTNRLKLFFISILHWGVAEELCSADYKQIEIIFHFYFALGCSWRIVLCWLQTDWNYFLFLFCTGVWLENNVLLTTNRLKLFFISILHWGVAEELCSADYKQIEIIFHFYFALGCGWRIMFSWLQTDWNYFSFLFCTGVWLENNVQLTTNRLKLFFILILHWGVAEEFCSADYKQIEIIFHFYFALGCGWRIMFCRLQTDLNYFSFFFLCLFIFLLFFNYIIFCHVIKT